ncbi:hypothetical protein BRADI_2g26212v3 [Brachypodium distachyon]|uniref:Uncharacterized protein n=1 Tax=Brachypodium distachyon TaxID=15368 RepID=A0A0Q3G4W6_BRADI|nr:hypothetical protein BRADI_2g26212v3 [Brachypodium distachyon]
MGGGADRNGHRHHVRGKGRRLRSRSPPAAREGPMPSALSLLSLRSPPPPTWKPAPAPAPPDPAGPNPPPPDPADPGPTPLGSRSSPPWRQGWRCHRLPRDGSTATANRNAHFAVCWIKLSIYDLFIICWIKLSIRGLIHQFVGLNCRFVISLSIVCRLCPAFFLNFKNDISFGLYSACY